MKRLVEKALSPSPERCFVSRDLSLLLSYAKNPLAGHFSQLWNGNSWLRLRLQGCRVEMEDSWTLPKTTSQRSDVSGQQVPAYRKQLAPGGWVLPQCWQAHAPPLALLHIAPHQTPNTQKVSSLTAQTSAFKYTIETCQGQSAPLAAKPRCAPWFLSTF